MAIKIVAVDFDGTIVTHEYPKIGRPIPDAIDTLRQLQRNGVALILWTMRSGPELRAAVDYCASNDITFSGINKNPNQKDWTDSPKAYAPIYIDDAALGCPLYYAKPTDTRPSVYWHAIRRHLIERCYLTG